MLVLVIFKPHL